jgi:hypothetical protein
VTEYVILQKIYGPRRQRCAQTLLQELRSSASGLEVEISLAGQTERGWARIDVKGTDEVVACNHLRQRFGIAPRAIEDLKSRSLVMGLAIEAGKVGYGLYVDVGFAQTPYVDALIPLHTLRSQIADGTKASTHTILETYCIVDNFPLTLRINRVDQTGKIEAEFSDRQISVFERWFEDGLDRVLAFGIPKKDIDEALTATQLKRDVVKVEQLGLFEHALLCKLGTEGVGVIARLGNSLRGIPLHAFSPIKARALSGSPKITQN